MSFSLIHLKAFLQNSKRARTMAAVVAILWGVVMAVLFIVDPKLVFAAVPFTAIVILAARIPEISIYLMALTFPFMQWQLVYGVWNVPIVDLVGLIALVGIGARYLIAVVMQPHVRHTIRLPAVLAFVGFIAIAGISVTNSWDPAASLKYFFRPLLFFYVIYILLVVNTVTTKRMLMHVLWIMYGVGLAIALYGFVGFFLVDAPSFLQRRAVPFGLFGFFPLGTNHNLIADVLVTIVPVGFFFITQAKTGLSKKMIFLGTLFMLGVALVTFSRSAWLALCVELCVLFGLYYGRHIRYILRYVVIAALIALPFIGYMVFFSAQDFVDASTKNRLILGDIAYDMWQEHPLFGAGAGTFISYVERNRVYMQEFGAPLDAHGFFYKVVSETGIVGLVFYCTTLMTILWILCRAYWRSTPPVFDALCISMLMMAAGSIFFQLFQTSYFASKLWFPLGIALAASYQSGHRRLQHVK